MSDAEPVDLLLPGAPDVRAAAITWLDGLGSEAALSPNTVEAYRRDCASSSPTWPRGARTPTSRP